MYSKGKWKVSDSAFTRYTTYRGKATGARKFVIDGELNHIAEAQGDTVEEAKANANLIASAVNACVSVNPDNPQAVAESIGDICEALKNLLSDTEKTGFTSVAHIVRAQQAISKVEGNLPTQG